MNAPRRRVVEAPARERPRLEAVRVVFEPDPNADVSYLDQEGFEERKRVYGRTWRLVGVHVEADVTISETAQTIKSGYCWGIESDSDDEELDELIAEEWRQARDVLKAIGVPTSELPVEVDRAWIEWRT